MFTTRLVRAKNGEDIALQRHSLKSWFSVKKIAIGMGVGLNLLMPPQLLEAATNIYRSVGPANTSPLAASGSTNTLDISGTIATFSLPLPSNIGVGDAIQYDANSSGSINAIAFIYERTSNNIFTVKDRDGGIPLPTIMSDLSWSVFRAYTSLFEAETGNENSGLDGAVRTFETWSNGKDLVVSDQIWNIACYNDGIDATAVMIDGWTTGPDKYIQIFTPFLPNQVGESQRHKGKWDTAAYRIMADPPGVWRGVIAILDDHVRIHGLQVEAQGTDPDTDGIQVDTNQVTNAGDIRISHNLGACRT